MVLPQILFLLQALPIILPPIFISTWNKNLANFIWNGKKHRIKFQLLTQPKEEGDLGVPYIQNYYFATQIQTIMKWMGANPETKWINIETELWNGQIGSLLFLRRETQRQYLQIFCIGNTTKNWRYLCKDLKIHSESVKLRQIRHDPDFKAQKTDSILDSWAKTGLTIFAQVFEKK